MGLGSRLRAERGEAVIEGLFAFGLLLLVVAVVLQAFAYAQSRTVAIAAAQEGATVAATGGAAAGTARARVLLAAGGVGSALRVTPGSSGDEVTIRVDGSPPRLFLLGLILPDIHVSASLPVEGYTGVESLP